MNILIVTAHPSSVGHTHMIAQTYTVAKKSKYNDIKIVDLYAKEYSVDLLTFENIRTFKPSKIQKKFQEQVAWAHEIVVIHPIWWGLPPAIMKNWADLTFWMGFAYKFTGPHKVKKLLKGKTAKIFVTNGGASWFYHFIFMPLLSYWKLCVFGFTGVEVIDVKICGHLDIYQGEKKINHFQTFLKKIEYSAKKIK